MNNVKKLEQKQQEVYYPPVVPYYNSVVPQNEQIDHYEKQPDAINLVQQGYDSQTYQKMSPRSSTSRRWIWICLCIFCCIIVLWIISAAVGGGIGIAVAVYTQQCKRVREDATLPVSGVQQSFELQDLEEIKVEEVYSVEVRPSMDSKVHVNFVMRALDESSTEKVEKRISMVNRKLSISTEGSKWIVWGCPTEFITLEIPPVASGLTLKVTSQHLIVSNASMSFNKFFARILSGEGEFRDISSQQTEISVKSGEVNVKNCTLGKSTFEVGSGDMNLENIHASTTDISVTSGKMNTKDSVLGDLITAVKSGDLIIENIEANTAAFDSVSGDIMANSVVLHGNTKIDLKSGKVEMSNVIMNSNMSLSIDITSGDVHMRLKNAPKSIEGSTTSGFALIGLPTGYSGNFELSATTGDLIINGFTGLISYTTNTKRHKVGTIGNTPQSNTIKMSTTSGELELNEVTV